MELTNTEMLMLEVCATESEWNTRCDEIKEVRGGQYPPDWWTRVVQSGVMSRVSKRFTENEA